MTSPAKLEILGRLNNVQKGIFTPEAKAFLEGLVREFAPRVGGLLEARAQSQARLDAGETLDFLPETEAIREGDWHGPSIPADLARRHVEITGPVERKMIINALNSGADCFMADFEDSSAPTFASSPVAADAAASARHRRAITSSARSSSACAALVASMAWWLASTASPRVRSTWPSR